MQLLEAKSCAALSFCMRACSNSYPCSDPYVTVSVGTNNRLQTSPVVPPLPSNFQYSTGEQPTPWNSRFAAQIPDDLNPVFNWKAGPFTWNGCDPVEVR